ncbi:hypothetical protein DW954_01960 [Clostridium sp. AM45-5]|nr:hypothetical protein [Clostridium sp. AM45-5]RHS68127.1 hypothetical protein DW954_01960 [Clostridium sp. AM45-5]
MSDISTNVVTDAIERQLEADQTDLEVEELGFDPLVLYYCEDFKVAENKITIHQPVIQDFITYGEDNIYSLISPFVSNRTSLRLQLWNNGLDWNKVSDQWLFCSLLNQLNPKYSNIMFGDIDFSTFRCVEIKPDGKSEIVLYSQKHDIIIDDKTRILMSKFIQHMFNQFPPEEEFTSSKQLKRDLINRDKQALIQQKNELKKSKGSKLLLYLSFCLNHPGFKYKKNELRDVGIFEFMDSVSRLNIYESTKALYSGMYSGMCDLSKVNKNEFNFMRDPNGKSEDA